MKTVLTEREHHVLECLVNGMTNIEISDKLSISAHTTKAHLEAIYEKLNVNNRVQASIKALQLKLVSLDSLSNI